MPIPIPTAADLAAGGTSGTGEVYGLRHTLLPIDAGDYYKNPDLFIHGRDYFVLMPSSPNMVQATDNAAFTRVYLLMADNVDPSTVSPAPPAGAITREKWVSAARLRLFMASLLGYPYVTTGSGTGPFAGFNELFRHLPEPYYAGATSTDGGVSNAGNDFTWIDTRGEGRISRFELHATKIMSVQGIGEEGQSPGSVATIKAGGWPQPTWTPANESVAWNPAFPSFFLMPDEGYKAYVITVQFARLPYEVMKKTDSSFGGEFSRFTLYQEESSSRALQIYAGVKWDTNLSNFGQPASTPPGVSGTFSSKEGVPKLIGENMLTWRWLDLPISAYNWNSFKTDHWTGIQQWFGRINDSDSFGSDPLTTAPFIVYGRQCLLLRTASRIQKTSPIGQPLWDVTLFFNCSPATDGLGYWNRLLNPNGVFQRYIAANGDKFYSENDFTVLFRSPEYWS